MLKLTYGVILWGEIIMRNSDYFRIIVGVILLIIVLYAFTFGSIAFMRGTLILFVIFTTYVLTAIGFIPTEFKNKKDV